MSEVESKVFHPNPVRKRHMPKLGEELKGSGAILAIMMGWRPWVASCPECGYRLFSSSRKVAKDRLHLHMQDHLRPLVGVVRNGA